MSAGVFGFINKWRGPVVIAITSSYFAFDVYRMKNIKESEICVKLKGKPIPGVLGDVPCPSPYLQEIIDEVKSGLNLPQVKKQALNYYVTPHPKPKVNGFYSSFSSIDIFLPDYFNISSGEQLTSKAIRNLVELMGESFESMGKDDWITPDGQVFINSFLLSRRAKKFAITQSSYANLNPEYHLKYAIFSLVILAFAISISLVEERVTGSIAVKLGFSLIMLIPLILLKNLLSSHSQMICDSKGIAQTLSRNMLTFNELIKTEDFSLIDEEMLLGALEYYSKLLQRQKAAHRLFRNGFSLPGILTDEGEIVNPFKLELSLTQMILQLEKIKSKLNH